MLHKLLVSYFKMYLFRQFIKKFLKKGPLQKTSLTTLTLIEYGLALLKTYQVGVKKKNR